VQLLLQQPSLLLDVLHLDLAGEPAQAWIRLCAGLLHMLQSPARAPPTQPRPRALSLS
jgi:hypothetical protein